MNSNTVDQRNFFFRVFEDKLKQIEEHHDECKFFDTFGILIQFLLFILTMIVLLYKKSIDPIKRTWLTWYLDISKLLICQGSQHCINLALGSIFGGEDGLECEWYILNLISDSLIGVFFQYIFLQMLLKILANTKYAFESGNYYIDGNFSIHEYLYQIFIWLFIVFFSKAIILALMLIFFEEYKSFGIFLLQNFKGKPKLKLLFVMIVIPMFLNTLQFWITDNFIKRNTVQDCTKQPQKQERLESHEKNIEESGKLIE